jgi:hypothetical protein
VLLCVVQAAEALGRELAQLLEVRPYPPLEWAENIPGVDLVCNGTSDA